MTVWPDGQGTWTTGPTELKKIAYKTFFELMVLLAIHGRFLSFRCHCLLSSLLCGSNMCIQVSSPVSKLEITRLLQPLYVFKSSRAHLRRCVFCSSVSKWVTHLAQTFLNLYSSDVSLGNRGFRPSRTGIIFNRKFNHHTRLSSHDGFLMSFRHTAI